MLLLLLCISLSPASAAFWPRYGGARRVTSLDGEWHFGFTSHFDALADFDARSFELTPNSSWVPSTVDVAPPGILGRRGVAMYRRSFQQRGHARLQFMGCSFYCRVFVNGKEVGEHRAGGFVPWHLDLPHAVGAQELFVLADNRFNRSLAPLHTGGDFWHYGGLVRSVLLHDLPQPFVWRAHVLPAADLRHVELRVRLAADFTGGLELRVGFDEGKEKSFNVTAQRGRLVLHLAVPNPRPWSLAQPSLHTVTLLAFGGSVTERFGLRQWKASHGRLTLNGQELKLHGWNHHTQWLDTGMSPTDEQLDQDIALLKEGNANFVRGAHYPQDQRWLDRLDEGGFAMWEETLGPNVSLEDTKDPYFMKYQLQQLEEMLEASMNHPSIMVWAWFNEGPSDQADACAAYAACAQLAGQDPTRLLSWASNKNVRDKCLDHATMVSFNSYPAWYGEQHNLSAPARIWQHYASWAKEQYPEKPFIISETGAGGIFEWKNSTDAMWSLKYQQEVVDRDVDVALQNSNVSGLSLWHFFDFKGNDDAQACGPCHYLPDVVPPTCGWYNMSGDCSHRPGGLNHKGVVDPYRRKKPVFESVQAKYAQRAQPQLKPVVV